MVMTSGGNVGIGNTAPTKKLDIASTTNGAIKIADGTQGANKVLTSDASGVGTWKDVPASTDTSIYNSNGTLTANRTVTQGVNTLAFTGSATNAFSVDGNTLSVDAANNRIGLGTNAPSEKLTVVDETNLNQYEGIASFLANNKSQGVGIGYAGIKSSGSNDNIDLNLNAKGTGAVIIQTEGTTGNVGIGVKKPITKLDIASTTAGAVKITDGTQGVNKVLTSDANGVGTWKDVPANTNIYNTNGTLTDNRTVTQGVNTLAFTGSAINAFSVDGNTLSVDAANNRIGLGTVTPRHKLDLGPDGGSEIGDTAGKKLALYNNSTGNAFYGLGVGPSTLEIHAGSASDGLPNMVMTSGGNVGIGNTTPTKKLDISSTTNGAIKIVDGTQGANKVLTSDANGIGTWKDIPATANTNIYNTDGNLTSNRTVAQGINTLAFTSNQTNGFSVDGSTFSVDAANNRVGIGNNSPSEKLTVLDETNLNQYEGIASFLANNKTQGIGIGYAGVKATGSNDNVDLNLNAKGIGSIVMQTQGTTGRVGIGTANPHASALLELDVNSLASGNKKGFLGPRVALASQTDVATIKTPAVGLMVYNLGTAGLKYEGYVYWTGSEWRTFNNASLSNGTVGSIICNSITLSPSTYNVGVPYTGTMNVSYTGGNGGIYPAQNIGPVNGLRATLSSGNFNNGAGTLSYTITGTPTVTSPITTTFQLNIGGKTCNAIIGGGDGIAPGELVFYKTSIPANTSNVWMSNYASDLPVLGGKLRLDAFFNVSSNGTTSPFNGLVSMYPRLVNISGSPVKIWFSAITTVNKYNAGNYLMAAAGGSTPSYVELDDGIYYNPGYNDVLGTSTPRKTGSGQGGHQEVLTVDLALEGKWYRIHYFPIVDNKNTATTADNTREIFLSIQRLY